MKNKPLNRFEAFAQRIIEGSFRKLFGEHRLTDQMAQQLVAAVESLAVAGALPAKVAIYLSPLDLATRINDGDAYSAMQAEFETYLRKLGEAYQLYVPEVLTVSLLEDMLLPAGAIRVEMVEGVMDDQSTQVQKRPFSANSELEAIQALDAYIIVTGHQHLALDKPLITIGRQLDNDVVLDAATVSRKHAQIRWRFGRFVLYDLSQRGRTVVNGVRVSEHALEPGDVIALSHMMIIYGEGHTRPQAVAKKQDNMDDKTRPMPKLDE